MSVTPRVIEPISHGFEYQIRLAVAIPLAWAQALKLVGEGHYDWKCREAARQGVVNGLYNVALFNDDVDRGLAPDDHVTHPISSSDCDLMLKILEQASYHYLGAVDVEAIRRWLRAAMDQIVTRHAEVARR